MIQAVRDIIPYMETVDLIEWLFMLRKSDKLLRYPKDAFAKDNFLVI